MKLNTLYSYSSAIAAFLLAPKAYATVINDAVSGNTTETGKLFGKFGGTPTDITLIVFNVIKFILGFLGIILVCFIIYAGFLWMTDQGKEEQVKTAQTILKNSFIGLIIIIAAYAITHFLIDSAANIVTGNPNTTMPTPGG